MSTVRRVLSAPEIGELHSPARTETKGPSGSWTGVGFSDVRPGVLECVEKGQVYRGPIVRVVEGP